MNTQQRLFYGWWVMIALFGVGMIGPLGRYSLTAFFPFISSEMGWSRTLIGSAQTINVSIYALFVPLIGWMTDRIGGRKVILIGGLISLVGWALLSMVRSVWQLYLYYGLVMSVGVSMTHYVPIQATSRKWFVKRAGLVAGILISAFSAGSAIAIPLLTTAATHYSWRNSSIVCAFVFGAIILLLALFVIRDTPESLGLRPDGDGFITGSLDKRTVEEKTWGVGKAIKTPTFWFLLIAFSFPGITINGLLSHLVMWAVDMGSTAGAAGIFVTALVVPMGVSAVGGGLLGDKYGKERIMMIGYACSSLTMLCAWQVVYTTQYLMVFVILLGICHNLPAGLFAPYLGDIFGRRNVGALFGLLTMGWGLIGSTGAVIWGLTFDTRGNYNLPCLMSAVSYAIAVLAVMFTRLAFVKTREGAFEKG